MVDKGYSVRFVYADLSQCWPSISSDKGHSPHRNWGRRDTENLCLHKGKIYGLLFGAEKYSYVFFSVASSSN